jgi:GNAT superfamily N-acetyltransferase
VISVPPGKMEAVRELVDVRTADWRDRLPVLLGLPVLVGFPARSLRETVFHFTTTPAPLPDAGVWIGSRDPALPEWLHPFGSPVLAAFDERGRYLAGVGIKRHDAFGHELAVGTQPHARGAGLARALVAQAARSVLADGAVPTYAHELGNLASARVAQAAGFPDAGWRQFDLGDAPALSAVHRRTD